MNPPAFFAGLDLGKRQDYTAFAVVELHRTLLGRDPSPGPTSSIGTCASAVSPASRSAPPTANCSP